MEHWLGTLIRRPVGVTAFYVIVLVLAVTAAVRLPIELLPSMRFPALLIWTPWQDVTPGQVERALTEPIEDALAGTAGISGLSSRSQIGGSLVRLDFGWSVDLDFAALGVREKLERLVGRLPDTAGRPLVLRIDPAQRPIMVVAVGISGHGQGAAHRLAEAKEISEEVVARRLEQLSGVGRVRTTGGAHPEIAVELDPNRTAAYGIELDNVVRALEQANAELAGGTVRQGQFRYAMEIRGDLKDLDSIGRVVISDTGAPIVRLRDVATMHETTARRRGLVRLDGQEVILLLVERRADANTVQTAAEVRTALDDLARELPRLQLDVVVDESEFVESALLGVGMALAGGAIFATLVLFVFIRQTRVIVAVASAVPLSLAMTLVLFDHLGISLNLISMSGLALGVGLLVDNAIVVSENIARWREAGLPPDLAAQRGAAEVGGALTASTLTTVAVFLPITFVEGLAGQLFRDQSLAIVCSVIASLFVALTAVPLIAAGDRGRASHQDPVGGAWLGAYERGLDYTLAHPRRTVAAMVVGCLLCAWPALELPREAIPQSDQGRIDVALALDTDADLGLVATQSQLLEEALLSWPEISHVLADLGERDQARLEIDPRPIYRGDLTVVLKAGADPREISRKLHAMPEVPGLTLTATPTRPRLQALLADGDSDLVIDLFSQDRSAARVEAERLAEMLGLRPELEAVARRDPSHAPAFVLHLDRDQVARFGVRPQMIQRQIEAVTRGAEATRLRSTALEVPVVVHGGDADSLEALLDQRIETSAGLLPLATFVHAEATRQPAMLRRNGRTPVVRLRADVARGYRLSDAAKAIGETAAGLPPTVRSRLGGGLETLRESLSAVSISLLLSTLLVYLILAAQFESLWQPFLVLSSIPMAAVGTILALAITGHSWNVMSLTGATVLIGIAVNDAIVKVDFIRRELQRGSELDAALREAGRQRFRPILLNTLTTGLGLLPLALSLGPGSELQAPLAVAILGGLLSATVLTLLVLPAIYRVVQGSPATWETSEST